MQNQIQIQNPKPKFQIQIVEFFGEERFREAAVKALEYYIGLLRDYLGTTYKHYEPHYQVKINSNEVIVRYMRVLRTVQYRDIDGKVRRRVEKIYWRVRALVS